MRRSNLLDKHKWHPDGWTVNLSLDLGDLGRDWVQAGPHEMKHPAGYSITAEFGKVDGFPCWKYRTSTPAGRTLGTYPSAAGAALWIDRDMRALTR